MINESLGGISAFLIILVSLIFPNVLDPVLFLLCVKVTVGYVPPIPTLDT